MRPGRHAADDGAFARQTGMAMGRGIILLGVALLIGIVLLQRTDTPKAAVSAGSKQTTTTASHTTTTVPPATTTTIATRPPPTVKVLAANGTDVQGAAGKVNTQLLAAKYNALSPTQALQTAKASTVYFQPGYDREGAAIAQLLQLPPTSVQPMPNPLPVKDLHEANVLVVVGPELAARLATTTSSTTSTTAKKTTSTTARSTTTTTAATTTTKKP